MMIGNPLKLAIESEITQASERPSQMALGFFVIGVMGRSYGVREPNATTLGPSFNEVGRRIAGRGSHNLPVVMEADAGSVASAFRRVAYGELDANERFFGMAAGQFRDAIYSNHLVWAPDGDEAFDDGSYVLQVESQDQVRLIAFKGTAIHCSFQTYFVRVPYCCTLKGDQSNLILIFNLQDIASIIESLVAVGSPH